MPETMPSPPSPSDNVLLQGTPLRVQSQTNLLLVVALTAILTFLLTEHFRRPEAAPAPTPEPAVAVDAHFVALGKAYLPQLGAAYASAWEDGAAALDSGQPLSAALGKVGQSWDANRSKLFDRAATPEFARIVPESQKDVDVTPTQRAAMAAAWRGFARGLAGKGHSFVVPLSFPIESSPAFSERSMPARRIPSQPGPVPASVSPSPQEDGRATPPIPSTGGPP